MLGVALAQLVDVCLVDRDGLLYRLVQRSPLVVSTHEAVIRCERITLPQGLGYASCHEHDLGSQRSSVEERRFHAGEDSMDRLKRVVGRRLGGSRRFDSEGAQTIAGLGECYPWALWLRWRPSGYAPNLRQGVHRADVAATRSHDERCPPAQPTTMTEWMGTSACGSPPRSNDASADTA